MDKTRKQDIFKFINANGYNILRVYSLAQENGDMVLHLQKGNTAGLVAIHVTNTEFYLKPNTEFTFENTDCSEGWMRFLAKEHPEMIGVLVSEIDSRKNELTRKSHAQLQALKDEYTRVYNQVCAEGNRLNDIKKGLLEQIRQPQEQE